MWLVYCALCLLAWGLWAFFPKVAMGHLQSVEANKDLVSMNVAVYQVLGTALCFAPIALGAVIVYKCFPALVQKFDMPKMKLVWQPSGVMFAMLAGVGAGMGGLFYVLAQKGANVTMVVTITALYPVVTILLGWLLLHERVEPRQWLGIALALVAMALVAKAPQYEADRKTDAPSTSLTSSPTKAEPPR